MDEGKLAHRPTGLIQRRIREIIDGVGRKNKKETENKTIRMDVNANDANIKYLLGRMRIFQKLYRTKRGVGSNAFFALEY